MKPIYVLSLLIGLGLCIYFYLFNFDNMSETMLINSVLYWYMPLTFGLYGLAASRISSTIDDSSQSSLKHLFSGKDVLMTVLAVVILIMGGLIGILLFYLPLVMFKVRTKGFDFFVALTGTLFWLVVLFVILVVLWPAL